MNNSTDITMAYLGLFILSPLLVLIGFGSGQTNAETHNKQVMTEVLAKGCINQPKDCKVYRDFYVAVENFKK